MPIHAVACPHCRTFLQLDPPMSVGHAIRCRCCSTTFILGGEQTAAADPKPEREPRPAPPKRPAAVPERPRRPRPAAPVEPGADDIAWQRLQQQQRKRLLIQSLVLVGGLVLLVGGIALLASSGGGKKQRKGGAASPGEGQPPLQLVPDDLDPARGETPRRSEDEEAQGEVSPRTSQEKAGGRRPSGRTEEEDPQAQRPFKKP